MVGQTIMGSALCPARKCYRGKGDGYCAFATATAMLYKQF